jgi:mannose-1-phosphate guanylyltransferase/phosphomannomutase
MKYHRITGDSDRKDVYDPQRALEKAAIHAGHFMFNKEKRSKHWKCITKYYLKKNWRNETMKAVIMAGGKGTRLRPLTSNTPKPMVPLLDRPCMEYTIELLKKYGITEIAVTLQFIPEAIRQYFGDGADWGVQLHYFEEDVPLGTAGSVKNAEEFLDETFIVISGDAVTDFNLAKAIAFHRQKEAVATLVLTRVENPLEFGVVMTDEQGSIIRFLEKPSWGEVFSDTVNTGIYIVQPEIFEYMKKGCEFDFSKDLFPLLMAGKRPLYGYVAEGYWSDIGNLTQYRQTQFDMLEGRVRLDIQGTELSPGIWIGENTAVSTGVSLAAPCYIGRNCVLEDHAAIGGFSVIGGGSLIRSNVSTERSVLWKNTFVDQGAELYGATLCRQVKVGAGAVIQEGAVLGDGSKVGMKSTIQAGVKVFPNKVVANHVSLNQSLIFGETVSKGLFGSAGIKGVYNTEITTGFADRLARAYGTALPAGSSVAVGHDASPFSSLLAESFISALQSAGIHTCHFGNVTSSVTRYGTQFYGCAGGMLIRRCSENEYVFEFFDEKGLPISKAMERKIENSYYQEDCRFVYSQKLGKRFMHSDVGVFYRDNLLDVVNKEHIRSMNYKVVIQFDYRNLNHIIPELLEELGCRVIQLNRLTFGNEDIARLVRTYEADFGIALDANAQRIDLITEQGDVVKEEILSLLQLLIQIECERKHTLHVPVHLSDIAEAVAKPYNRRVVRTKVDMRSIMEGSEHLGYHIYYDGLYTLVQIMQMMASQSKSLSQLVESIPDFTLLKKHVDCPWSEKGKVMRFLMEETQGKQVELIDGIKVYHDEGWTLILPDGEQPTFQIYSNAASRKQAEELALFYTKKIVDYHRMKQSV